VITASAWAATVAAILGLLALELVVDRRRTGPVSLRDASVWSVAYLAIALGFGVVLGLSAGWDLGVEYLAGYAVEKSLSIDNLFVFLVIITTFAVPEMQRPRLLTIGILAALGIRVILIAAGAAMLDAFSFTFGLFGAVLLVTAVHLVRHRGEQPDVTANPLVRRLRKVIPTPAGLALVTMVGADAVFGLDSIPAVYGVSDEPFVVFGANAFALLGLRPLFFLVSGLVRRLVYLPVGMAAVLAFIGVKLILHSAHAELAAVPTVSTPISLAVIFALLGAASVASLVRTRPDEMRSRPHSAGAPETAR
jgi:tellurite resistance protein TerC